MTLDKQGLETMIRQIIMEKLGENAEKKGHNGVISIPVPVLGVDESHRLDTKNPIDRVYTRDLFTLEESPRLGCGIMEMTDTTFDWTLHYDEIDYVVEGELTIVIDGKRVSAKAGEVVLIPRDSQIQFSVTGHARFLYFTYPADWANG